MLARRACTHVLNSLPASQVIAVRSRSFTVAAATQSPARAPTLADITPNTAADFNRKQQEFRDSLVAAQKQKEQQESESSCSKTSA
jgi:cell pole-organizing protein PopZ